VPTYLARGRADLGFVWNLIVAIVNGVVFYLLAGYGIIVLTLAFAAISLLQFVVMQTITGMMIDLKWRAYLGAMALNTGKSIIIGVLAYVSFMAGRSLGLGDMALLAIMVLASAIAYLAMAVAFNREYLQELWGLLVPGAET
jgi:hypothetical protein